MSSTPLLPNPTSGSAVGLETEKYCVFQRGNETLAILATAVREVALRPSIALVPDADPMLAGLCHLRNEFLPVVQLSDYEGAFRESPHQQIMVFTAANGSWALLVDRVIGLVPLEVSLSSQVGSAGGWTSALMGSASHEDQIIQVLDANALFRFVEESLNRYWGGEVAT